MSESVGTALLDEIERVSAMRARWQEHARETAPQGCFGPALLMMTAAIDAGKKAIADDDAIAAIGALRDLRSFDADE